MKTHHVSSAVLLLVTMLAGSDVVPAQSPTATVSPAPAAKTTVTEVANYVRLSNETVLPLITISNYAPLAPVLLVYSDGRIIWSADPVEGGPPYSVASIQPEQIAQTLSELEELHLFPNPDTRGVYAPRTYPPFPLTTLTIYRGGKLTSMQSCHLLYEADGTNALVDRVPRYLGDDGLTEDGKSLHMLVEEASPAHRHYREAWDKVREKLFGLIPTEGTGITSGVTSLEFVEESRRVPVNDQGGTAPTPSPTP